MVCGIFPVGPNYNCHWGRLAVAAHNNSSAAVWADGVLSDLRIRKRMVERHPDAVEREDAKPELSPSTTDVVTSGYSESHAHRCEAASP